MPRGRRDLSLAMIERPWPWDASAPAAVGVAGAFAREIALVVLPIWCVRNVRRGVVFAVPQPLLDVVPRLRWVTFAGAIPMAAGARIVLHHRRAEA